MTGKYRTIVADPPWPHQPQGSHGHLKRIPHKPLPYQRLTITGICGLPVADIAASDCRLFLWTTSRYLRPAFDVLEAWGFSYGQTLIWHKTGNPSPLTGGVAPSHAEFLLVASRGKPALLHKLSSSVIAAPKPNEHSRKPDIFLDLVELASPGPYAELFARRARFGWEYPIGDQALGGIAA